MRLSMLIAPLAIVAAPPAAAQLAPGDAAPDFTTQGALAGQEFTLHLAEKLKQGPVILYFFPAAFTPGCNAEAAAFADAVDDFRAAGASVIGMSADGVEQLKPFSQQHCAGKFPVASATPAIISGYDVSLGRQYQGRNITSRTSYVIGQDGKVAYAFTDSNPARHVANTLAAVRELAAE
ncbi:peroxiredoxin [Stakelama tenebrarum]|uniref:thioredoxin-dependent peroxiredoxin n=1 Tax=Stakelama tenebrarum TaxID=2711215 RepID=A0A6G6Y1I3_9SPHN|nr:redoxin domain-containing protein [Sphingosinithalassobacter tenebrarum]QIG78785.1 redoxin domain-containing protein [Sphingosinithalassobacter tenebrarum]